MSRVKLMMVAVFAALALSAALASAASATEEWKINGVGLGQGHSAAIASLPKIDLSLILHFTVVGNPSVSILILCASVHIIGGMILWPNTNLAKAIHFLKCHTISPTPTNCVLKAQSTAELTLIKTGPVLSIIRPGGHRILFRPDSGKLFTEIPFEEGTACVLEGAIPVKGETIGGAPTGNEERVEQGLVGLGSEENNSLEVGSGNKGFLLGKILLSLASGEPWSFS